MPVFSQTAGPPLYANRNVFVWRNFPGTVSPHTGKLKIGAGRMYYSLLHQYMQDARKRGEAITPDRVVRMKLMKEVERKCLERDADDLFTLLAV